MEPQSSRQLFWLSVLRVWVPVVYIALALVVGAWGLVMAHGWLSWAVMGLAFVMLLGTPILWSWCHPKTRGDRKYDALY